jgi:putative ABC transport system permease protein
MLAHYLKLAVKVLRRRKFFTFISLFGVSFSLLVLLVVAALFDHIFAPHAPETRGDRTLGVYFLSLRGEGWETSALPGYAFLDRYVRPMADLPEVEQVALASYPRTEVLYIDGRRVESYARRTDGDYWQILDFDFVEGRPFTPDDVANARFVAVINEATRRRFFGEAQAVGRTFDMGGRGYRVVGVVRDVPILRSLSFSDIWTPHSTDLLSGYRKEWVGDFYALLLARDRTDFGVIKADFQERLREALKEFPNPSHFTASPPKGVDNAISGTDTPFEGMARQMLGGLTEEDHAEKLLAALLLLLTLFLVLPSLNLININLSRILERSSEIGVRKAFGASSGTLVAQFVVENVVLTLVGALIGLALAVPVLAAVNASGLIAYSDLSLNFRIFFQGLGMALFFGVLSGVYPAWRMSRFHPVYALKGGSL